MLAFSHDQSVKMTVNSNRTALAKKKIPERRQALLRIINIVLFLGRQGIAFRGTANESAYSLFDTTNHGNFLEMVKCQVLFDPVLVDYVNEAVEQSRIRHEKHPGSRGRGALTTFLSKTTINDLLTITGDMIQEFIRDEIDLHGGHYSLCTDSTQDISVKEQTCLVVRYVDDHGPVERLIDVVETPQTTGEALYNQVVGTLTKLRLKLAGGLLAYAFDGAPNMAGGVQGLQGRLGEAVPESVFTHCYAHVLQLVMTKSCSCVVEAITLFNLLQDCPTIISESHKRMQLWADVVRLIFPNESKIVTSRLMVKLSKTRWWAKCKAMKRVFTSDKSLLPVVIVVLELISRDTDKEGKIRAKARGCALKWCTFETLAVGYLFIKIFTLVEPVSKYLQSPDLDHVQAARMTSSLIPSVAAIRVEAALTEAKALAVACNTVLQELDSLDAFVKEYGMVDLRVSTEAVRRRVPVVPRKPGEMAEDDLRKNLEDQPPETYIRTQALIPILDRCLAELRGRFEGESCGVFKACSFLNPQWFEKIVRGGIPNGALAPLCRLTGVDEEEARDQLLDFARNFERLRQSIQVDFRPQDQSEILNTDEEGSENEESDDTDDKDSPTPTPQVRTRKKDTKTKTTSFDCNEELSKCKGCLRCSYRLLRKYGFYLSAYNVVWKLYKCALTLPCTQISCERCFSKLKVIKNRLRNTMSQDNLRNVHLMSVERNITFKLDHGEMLDRFAKTSDERTRLLLY